MKLIIEQSKKFNQLVLNHFKSQYKLKTVNNIYSLDHTKPELMYTNRNNIILNNKIVNQHYLTTLDETKYSLVFMFYKNIYYNEKSSILDFKTKQNIKKIVNLYKKEFLDENVIIIGRKYINRKTKEICTNSVGLYCSYISREQNKKQRQNKDVVTNLDDNFRTIFLQNLNKITQDFDIKRTLFLDVEYVNDLYDDFKTFPISVDSSLLFMIGTSEVPANEATIEAPANEATSDAANEVSNEATNEATSDAANEVSNEATSEATSDTANEVSNEATSDVPNEEVLSYTNYTVTRLADFSELDIMERYIHMLYDKINKHEKIYILHWSNADKYIIDKTLQKYQKLNEFYKSVCEPNLQYIDLLKLTKSSIKLESYSLKHVAKTLLDIDYNTDCKNGFDAMCSIIQNNNKLTSKDKELCDFTSTKDIIQYNKLDTELLYYILNYFLKFKV